MNTVTLLGHYGGDKTHAMSAWTSTSRDYEAKKERMPELLKMLAENGHHTPFEKSTLHFLVRCDTATHIHLLKHRIGVSINGESARYKRLKDPTYLIPEDLPLDIQNRMNDCMYDAVSSYKELLHAMQEAGVPLKRAKESARLVLPYGNQLTLDVSFNFRSFMHFLELRLSEHAQVEIADIASQMLFLVRELPDFHHSLMAFGHR
jgi:thymidylate synthase (FAD)